MARAKSMVTRAREKARELGESFVFGFFGLSDQLSTDRKFVDDLRCRPGFQLRGHFVCRGTRVRQIKV